MWSATVDKSRQLLELKFAERVGVQEAEECAARVHELLADLKPGFNLLTDLSGLVEMDLACRPVIDELMDTCNRQGIRKVIRVIPDPGKDIGFGIMSLFHYSHHVRVVTCDNLEAAQKLLQPKGNSPA